MSDLISRSAVIEFVKEELNQDRPYDFKIKNIKRFIEDMPTAYDVEKVVEELEEKSIVEMKFNGRPPIQNIDIDKAIDIARKGGVE